MLNKILHYALLIHLNDMRLHMIPLLCVNIGKIVLALIGQHSP